MTKIESDLYLACQTLAALVHDEFPGDSLVKIASTWLDDVTEQQLAALESFEKIGRPSPVGL